jgi:glucosamine 6-phosphate synthetase-like amidotransferase/phosphosugar isomerase protein
VGIHNGIILNDDELLSDFSCARAEPRMTVDSEAIFALAAHSENDPHALEALTGAMATAWLDQREPGVVFAARGVGRPLWLGRGRNEIFFASTRDALDIVSEYTGVRLRTTEVHEGTFLALQAGRVARTSRFRPDHDYVEESPLPTVRAPGESEHCLARLAAITAAAA